MLFFTFVREKKGIVPIIKLIKYSVKFTNKNSYNVNKMSNYQKIINLPTMLNRLSGKL